MRRETIFGLTSQLLKQKKKKSVDYVCVHIRAQTYSHVVIVINDVIFATVQSIATTAKSISAILPFVPCLMYTKTNRKCVKTLKQ